MVFEKRRLGDGLPFFVWPAHVLRPPSPQPSPPGEGAPFGRFSQSSGGVELARSISCRTVTMCLPLLGERAGVRADFPQIHFHFPIFLFTSLPCASSAEQPAG